MLEKAVAKLIVTFFRKKKCGFLVILYPSKSGEIQIPIALHYVCYITTDTPRCK